MWPSFASAFLQKLYTLAASDLVLYRLQDPPLDGGCMTWLLTALISSLTIGVAVSSLFLARFRLHIVEKRRWRGREPYVKLCTQCTSSIREGS